jgi:PHD/YefM family antitoxin component YafN of YafNO toxin-antitoxin module
MAASRRFQTIDVEQSNTDMARLHAQVLRNQSRVEVRSPAGISVLISKSELDSLERALEILSQTETMRQMRQELARVASIDVRAGAVWRGSGPIPRLGCGALGRSTA